MSYIMADGALESFKAVWNGLSPRGGTPRSYATLALRFSVESKKYRLDQETATRLYGPLPADVHIRHYQGFALMVSAAAGKQPTVIRFLNAVAHRLRFETIREIKKIQRNTVNVGTIQFERHALDQFESRYAKDVSSISPKLPIELQARFLLGLSDKETLPDLIRIKRMLANRCEETDFYRCGKYRFVLARRLPGEDMRVVTFEVAYESKCKTTRV